MEFMEKRMEVRGIRRNDIVNYFIGKDGKEMEDGKTVGQDWDVFIGEETSVKLGSLIIPAVIVIFRSKTEIFQDMMDEFFMRFLRMGG